MEEQAREYIQNVIAALAVTDFKAVVQVAEVIKLARSRGSTVFLFGNGGSAATASHFQNDLMKMCGVKAICISDMTALTTAYANDEGYENAFSWPIWNYGDFDDIIIAFSCSGNSKNVVNALKIVENAKRCVLFTGDKEGEAEKYANIIVKVPHDDIKVQEDCHLALCHCIAGLLSDAK